MEYITLKNTDLRVSRLCMGGCPLGGHGWGNIQDENLINAVQEAFENRKRHRHLHGSIRDPLCTLNLQGNS